MKQAFKIIVLILSATVAFSCSDPVRGKPTITIFGISYTGINLPANPTDLLRPIQPMSEKSMVRYNNTGRRNIGGPAGRNLDHFSTGGTGILNARDNGNLCLFTGDC